MLRKIGCENFSTFNILTRHYRTKAKDAPVEQRFIKRVIQMRKKLSEEHMPQLLEKLEVVKRFGFKPFEIIESPEILELESKELERRLRVLQEDYKSKPVLLSMAKHLKSSHLSLTNSLLLDRHLKSHGLNGISGVEHLRKALRCSDEQMLDILARNPRLRSVRKNPDIAEKVEILHRFGARPEDIWANTSLLTDKPLGVIESRARTLSDVGYNKPLPIGHIGRTDEEFRGILSKWQEKDEHAKFDALMEVLREFDYIKSDRLYLQKEKLDYILGQGYGMEEILANPYLFGKGLETIKSSLKRLKDQYLDRVPLSRVVRMLNGFDYPPEYHKFFFKRHNKLKGHLTPEGQRKLFAYVREHRSSGSHFERNLAFLTERGFSKEDLSRLPIVLCNGEEVLRDWWEVMSGDARFQSDLRNDRMKALNKLQYRIERSGQALLNPRHFVDYDPEVIVKASHDYEEEEEFMDEDSVAEEEEEEYLPSDKEEEELRVASLRW